MRKLLVSYLLVLGEVMAAHAEPTLKEARQRWLRGNYEEALEQYQQLGKNPTTRVPALIGASRAQQSLGKYQEALAAVEAACKEDKPAAALLARYAEVLHLLGKRDEALKAAVQAIEADKDNFLARWVRAQIYSERGDLQKADAEFRWFVRTYTERSNADKDIKDPEELTLVGLAGIENVRLNIKEDNTLSEQFTFVLNDVYGDAVKQDKDYWPAEYQAGMLLLDKYNRPEALKAFDNALKINPRCAEAFVGKAALVLQRLEVQDAERAVEQALKINPQLPEALQLRADLHVLAGNFKAAATELEKARAVNPRREDTLGRLAACYLLLRDQKALDALAAEVEKENPKAGPFYFQLAERLESRRFFEDAEKYYKKALSLRPQLNGAENGLGLLYMRMGREEDARKVLDEAFKGDPFNVRVSNNRKVLKHLEKYETLPTEHFRLRYDPKHDPVLAQYMAGYLEEIYTDLSGRFQYQPKEPILVEVFNTHEMFSGRVVSLPDLHTIGACTGKMVAMASPRARGVGAKFNWARVLRHELVHIFNLEQTRYQVPHWLTEGLAVENEGFPRPQVWNHLLLERVPQNKLRTLEDIDMGFMRPGSSDEWHLAYCQSQLYVQYLKRKYGGESISEMLAAYRDGLGTAAAIRKVCGVEAAELEKGYRAFLGEVVKGLTGKPEAKVLEFAELKAVHEKDPADPDVAARLAYAYLRRGENAEARKLADKVLESKKTHGLASYVKAALLKKAGDDAEARKLLEAAVDENDPEPRVLQELAKLYFTDKQPEKAARLYELGRKAQPYEKKWLEGLARVYAEAGNKAQQIAVLRELVPLDADDLDSRKVLAQLLLDANLGRDAEKYARQALEIDVLDTDAKNIALKALKAQNKDEEAKRLDKLLAK